MAALHFADRNGLTPASARISFARDSAINLAFAGSVVGLILFILWANFLITAWSNAVNLTDGLDGLAAGASAMVFGAYTLIGVWKTNQSCNYGHETMVPTTCSWGPASASCGGTPHRPRSSWATPGPWPWEGRLPACRS